MLQAHTELWPVWLLIEALALLNHFLALCFSSRQSLRSHSCMCPTVRPVAAFMLLRHSPQEGSSAFQLSSDGLWL